MELTKYIFNYTVVIEPAEEGGYWAYIPALPGCFTQGQSLGDVIAQAKEAASGFVEMMVKLGKPIPVEKSHSRRSTFNIEVKAPVMA